MWGLLIQGVLNASNLPSLLDEFGTSPIMETDYRELLKALAANKVRLILTDLAKVEANKHDIAEGRFNFLTSKATYKTCMDSAWQRFNWKKLSL